MKLLRKGLLLTALLASGVSSMSARAQGWDAIVGGGVRTLPWGAGISGNLGYNLMWWGDHKPGEFFYGYLRPYVRVQTSGLVNRFEGGIEAFPLSFLGVQFGGAAAHRSVNLGTLDCDTTECRGWLRRNLVSTKLLLAYDRWILVPFIRIEGLKPQFKTRAFGDENTNLRGHLRGDTLIGSSWTAGYRVSPVYLAGFFLDTARMIKDGSNNLYGIGFARATWGPSTWTFGAGWYRSTFQKPAFTASLVFERSFFASSLALK